VQNLLRQGGDYHYGFIPAVAFAVCYLKRSALPALRVLDVFSPSAALGVAVARIGCFMAGCCYGKPIQTPPKGIISLGVDPQSPLLRTHPTQLYESAAAFLSLTVLIFLLQRTRAEGLVFCWMLILLATARFIIEFFRDDPGRGFILGGAVSIPQLASALILISGLILLFWINRIDDRQSRQALALS
jgi:phosphatidylglycerol:prolipoprotein diacylglycerol transferase